MPKKLFILSADDDRDDQDLIEEALKKTRFEYQLDRVSDGLQLIHMLNKMRAESQPLPDILFIDLNMPVRDGRETIKTLKSEDSLFRNIPAVILTTSSSMDDVHNCYRHGANLYLVKPYSFTELINILDTTLTRFFQEHMFLK